jgi:hypothetical protein
MSDAGDSTPAHGEARRAAQTAADAAKAMTDAARRFGGPLAAWRPRRAIRRATAASHSASAAAEADPPRPLDAARWAIEAAQPAIDAVASSRPPVPLVVLGRARDALVEAQRAARSTLDDNEAASAVAGQVAAIATELNKVADRDTRPRRVATVTRIARATARPAPPLDATVRSLVAVILTGTLIALVLFSTSSTEAATAGETLALAGLGFYFGSASRQLRRGPLRASTAVVDAPEQRRPERERQVEQQSWQDET